jgi:hypothetical protein
MAIIRPYQKVNLPIKQGNFRSVEFKFRGKFTRQQVRDVAQGLSNKLFANGITGKNTVCLFYPYPRSGGFTVIGRPVKLYEYVESDYIEGDPEGGFRKFSIIILSDSPKLNNLKI